jgi:hypothetical protein
MRIYSASLLFLLASLAQFGCADSPCAARYCEAQTSIATSIDFALKVEDGVSVGFDLDDRVSADLDKKTCGHADMRHPDGTVGIDNNAAVLFEAINRLTEASIEELIRGSINEGRLLMGFQLLGVDNFVNDDCVDVEIFQAKGTPQVGTDEFIVPGQTFDIDEEQPRTSIKCARIKDGVLYAGPFDEHLFVSILGVHVNLSLTDAKLAAEIDSTGIHSITLGAGIDRDEMHSVVEQTNDATVSDIGHYLIDSLADMGSDGSRCQQMSATVLIENTNAFLF